MGNPSIKYLLYREFVLSKKSLIVSAVSMAIAFVAAILVQVSVACGNLSDSAAITEKIGINMTEIIPFVVVLVMTVLPFMTFEPVMETVVHDVEPKWTKFRLSTPAAPIRFVIAKYVFMFSAFIISAAFSALGMGIAALIGNNSINAETIMTGSIIGFVFIILAEVMQVGILYFRSRDKAGLAVMAVMVPIALIMYNKFSHITDDASEFDINNIFDSTALLKKMIPEIAEMFPAVAAVTAAVVIVGFFLSVKLYSRREK